MDHVTWIEIAGIVLVAIGLGSIPLSVIHHRTDRVSAAADAALEHQRRHDDLSPSTIAAVEGEVQAHPRFGGLPASLMASITVPRDYRVVIDALVSPGGGSDAQASWPIGLPLLLRAGRPYTFEIEQWPSSKTTPIAKVLRIRYWPPTETDMVDPWTCPCRRSAEHDDRAPGHWEAVVPVVLRQTVES